MIVANFAAWMVPPIRMVLCKSPKATPEVRMDATAALPAERAAVCVFQ